MRFQGVVRRETFAPQQIEPQRNGFKMFRIHATGIATEMVKRKAMWNQPYHKFVGKPMGAPVLVPKDTVATFYCCGFPWPASIWPATLVYLGPKALTRCERMFGILIGHRESSFPGVMQPEVIGLAAASIVS